ncbi:HAD family hydrolase [Sinomicrobium weinanense]|uniref:HAD hydrolase-like protein n=1 Tax=Sinomicrobium weinanense TaxID=2842200 RepID=A0A926JSI4_9FLAO|nr:HAD family hydrolase [Sinomicrobium weinanense]MBC9796710.1 HAD hydrolase-like protein [Sinomicrobium weinanense]MBU3123015.1 HAD hydrolase-like protein [Sinomicrobium weinanense]
MEINYDSTRVIGFDADDTLWVNETYFREAEQKFARLLSAYETENKIDQELFKVEMDNLELYGYGIKGFMLSMIESAIDLSNGKVPVATISEILHLGKEMISKPVELLDGVEEVLRQLSGKYRLVLLTKGDLLDQERKMGRSGLSEYFHHIEVLSEKKEENYRNLLEHLEIREEEFLMIGNSLKSDILPIVNIGAQAIHVPFHTTWAHEIVREDENNGGYRTVNNIKEVLRFL